jgi:hypothetical protein
MKCPKTKWSFNEMSKDKMIIQWNVQRQNDHSKNELRQNELRQNDQWQNDQ